MKYKNKFKTKLGMTLVETLITLTIIAVVSVIVLGTVVSDTKRNETTVRLKKSYSVLQQALEMAVAKNGDPGSWEVMSGSSGAGSLRFFDKYLKEQMILAKDCKIANTEECDFIFKELNANERSLDNTWTRFYLNDGTFIAMKLSSDNNNKLLMFYVDTNGKKRLNVVARNIFLFEYWIENKDKPSYVGKLLPYGHQYSRDDLLLPLNDNSCHHTATGNYCAAVIMKDNWEMTLGYPWAHARYAIK